METFVAVRLNGRFQDGSPAGTSVAGPVGAPAGRPSRSAHQKGLANPQLLDPLIDLCAEPHLVAFCPEFCPGLALLVAAALAVLPKVPIVALVVQADPPDAIVHAPVQPQDLGAVQ